MKKISLMGLLLCASLLQGGVCQARSITGSAATKAATGFGLLASKLGAVLNADRLKGGGTDDTAALQAVLNRAEHGAPIHLIIDGTALVSGLDVYGNTTVECINGGGLYLRDGSSRAILRNAHRSREAIQDERITVRGCFLNGNRAHQPSATVDGFPSNKEADGTFITGLQFLGVNDLNIEDMTLWNIRSLGAWIANANRIDIRNVTVDYRSASEDLREVGQIDGLHFNGPVHYVNIDGVKLRTADDALSFCANDMGVDDMTVKNDMGPYVGQGPITDVIISHVQLMDSIWGIRLLSSKDRIDRILINNVTGTLRGGYLANISHFTNASLGHFGSISINHVDVDRSAPPEALDIQFKQWAAADPGFSKEMSGGTLPLISINAAVQTLSLQDIQTQMMDARPILRFGPDATVNTVIADLRIDDATLQTTPVVLDGSRIESLNLSLLWSGATLDQGKVPISVLGGTIGQLNWINTPPKYVSARWERDNTLAVTFSQDVKAVDFKAGVSVKVNDKTVPIKSAARQPRTNVVHYILAARVQPADSVTWAYDAAEGAIQNWNGSPLLSVTEKKIDRISQGVARIPATFDRVASLERASGGILVWTDSGAAISVPCELDFLKEGCLQALELPVRGR